MAGWLRPGATAASRPPDRPGLRAVPDPRDAGRRPAAGDLSGGQQQMLALAMALVGTTQAAPDRRALPRPGPGDRRRAPASSSRRRASRAPTVVLVEQSVQRRPPGRRHRRVPREGRGPLPRARPPTCSTGPTSCDRCSSRGRPPASPPTTRQRPSDSSTADAVSGATEDRRRPSSSPSGLTVSFGGIRAVDRRRPRRRAPARSSASSGRTAPARPRSSTSCPGSSAPTTGGCLLGGADVTSLPSPAGAGRASAGLPGRPAVPVDDRRPRRSRSPASGSSPPAIRSRPRCTCRTRTTPSGPSPRGSTSCSSSWGSAEYRSDLRPRALDRHPPHRRPRLPARPPAVGHPPRRAVERHRPARGRGARPRSSAASATPPAPPSSSIEHDMPLLRSVADRLDRHGPGRGHRRRPTRRRAAPPRGRRRLPRAPPNRTPSHRRYRRCPSDDAEHPVLTESAVPAAVGLTALGPDRRHRRRARRSSARLVVLSGGDDDDGRATTAAGAGTTTRPPATRRQRPRRHHLLRGRGAGPRRDLPETCDTETGRVAMPYFFAPECFADVERRAARQPPRWRHRRHDQVVVYVAPGDRPVLDFITAAIDNDDTNAQVRRRPEGYVDHVQARCTRPTGARWSCLPRRLRHERRRGRRPRRRRPGRRGARRLRRARRARAHQRLDRGAQRPRRDLHQLPRPSPSPTRTCSPSCQRPSRTGSSHRRVHPQQAGR